MSTSTNTPEQISPLSLPASSPSTSQPNMPQLPKIETQQMELIKLEKESKSTDILNQEKTQGKQLQKNFQQIQIPRSKKRNHCELSKGNHEQQNCQKMRKKVKTSQNLILSQVKKNQTFKQSKDEVDESSEQLYQSSDDENSDEMNFKEYQKQYGTESQLDIQKDKQKIIKRQDNRYGEWTKQQNIKYLAFLQLHETDFQKKMKLLIRQWADYAANGHYVKLKARYYCYFLYYKDSTIKQYAEMMRNKLGIEIDEIEKEKAKRKQFQEEELKTPDIKTIRKSRLSEILSKTPSYSFDDNVIKLILGQKTKTLKASNVKYQVLPFTQTNFQYNEDEQKRFMEIVSFDFQYQNQEKMVFNQTDQSLLHKKQDQGQESQEQFQLQWKDRLPKIIQWDINNVFNESQILSRIDKDYIRQTNPLTAKLRSNTVKRNWRYVEKTKFVIFVKTFREAFEDLKQVPMGTFQRMSQFIQSRDPFQCLRRFNRLTRKFTSLHKIIEFEVNEYGLDQTYIEKESERLRNQYLKIKVPVILFQLKQRLRTYEAQSVSIEKLSLKIAKLFLIDYFRQLKVLFKFS